MNGITIKKLVESIYKNKNIETDFKIFKDIYTKKVLRLHDDWTENTFIEGEYLLYMLVDENGYSHSYFQKFKSEKELIDVLINEGYDQQYYDVEYVPIINGVVRKYKYNTVITLEWIK